MSLPKQHPLHCDEDQAEQVLYGLLEDGKIKEIVEVPESGKLEPRIE